MVHNGVMMHYNVNYVQQYTVQRSLWNFQCFLMQASAGATNEFQQYFIEIEIADSVMVPTPTGILFIL